MENKFIVGLTYMDRVIKDNPDISPENAAFTVSRYIPDIKSRELFSKYQEMSENGKLELFSIKEVGGNWILYSKLNPENILKVFNKKPDNQEIQHAISRAMRLYMKENIEFVGTFLREHKNHLKSNFLATVVFPTVPLTESITADYIFEEIELYEGFLDSIKNFLRSKADDTMSDVSSTITNFKDAGIIIKDVISDADVLEKASMQIGKRLLNQLKTIKGTVTKIETSTNNNVIDQAAGKINQIIDMFYAGQRKSVQLGGWKGLLYKLGMYGFVKFVWSRITQYSKLSEFVNFAKGAAIEELIDKLDVFQNMMNSVASLTMQKFMNFFAGLNEVKEIFIDMLAEIKRKLGVGNNLSTTVSPISEHGGRVVKGVNTTVDVGPNEIKTQAAKFGNKVNKDGYPPELNKKARKNTTSNKLFNMGLAEEYDRFSLAIMEGGHTLEEGPRDALRRLGKAAAVASSLGTVGTMGATGYSAYQDQSRPRIEQPSSSSELAPASSIRPQQAPRATSGDDNASELAPTRSLRPEARPQLTGITGNRLENMLLNYAHQNGIRGTELAALMAQSYVETEGFTDMTEDYNGSPEEYFNGRYSPDHNPAAAEDLGNTQPGDGFRFFGRGFLQLTGRYNYERAGREIGIDLVNNPDLAADPEISLRITRWFWRWKVTRLTDNFDDTGTITRLITGHESQGLDRRQQAFDDYQEQFDLNESEIVDLSKKREDKKLKDFHKKMSSDIKSLAELKREALNIAYEQGIFGDFRPGMRFTLPNGASYKVLGLSMKTSKTDKLPNHQLEFRKKHNFGPAKFIEVDGKFYQPMVYAEEMAGEMAGSNSGFDLDKLINFETGEKRYTTFTGPKRVTEKKKPDQVKGKEKMPKKSKPSKTGEQPHPYRGRLVGENTYFKDGKVSKDFINYIKENISITGTETARLAKKKGLEPGTPEWFEHWFSLPYMIDRRKKNKGREGKR